MGKNIQNTKTNDTKDTTFDKKEKLLCALTNNRGNITKACEAANIGRKTFYRWRDKDEDFKQQCEDVGESLLDKSEDKLMELIEGGNVIATIFFLKTKGKKRGYIEKQEFEVSKPIDDIEFHAINE